MLIAKQLSKAYQQKNAVYLFIDSECRVKRNIKSKNYWYTYKHLRLRSNSAQLQQDIRSAKKTANIIVLWKQFRT